MEPITTEVFEDIRPYLEEADIVMGNLETTISTDEKDIPHTPDSEALFPYYGLERGGFDVLTTANNHTLDAWNLELNIPDVLTNTGSSIRISGHRKSGTDLNC